MAKTLVRPNNADLYHADYYSWIERQTELLRRKRFADLDLENLIEEIEDLGRSERRTVESYVETIVEQLLKLAYLPATRPRRGWAVAIDKQRAKLQRELTPTLRNHLLAILPELYAGVGRPVATQLARDQVDRERLPQACPYSLDQILNPDWLPANDHGVRDEFSGGEGRK